MEQYGSWNVISNNSDMSNPIDFEEGNIPVEPGKDLYIQRPAEPGIRFASVPAHIVVPATRPAAPVVTVTGTTADTITLSAITGGEYGLVNGADITWQDSNVFTGLTPDTEYTFTARIKWTDSSFASDKAVNATGSTLDGVSIAISYTFNGTEIFNDTAVLTEGKNTVTASEALLEENGVFIKDNTPESILVTVTDTDGVLTASTDTVEFQIDAEIDFTDFTYRIAYFDTEGNLLGYSDTLQIDTIGDISSEDMPILEGYKMYIPEDETEDEQIVREYPLGVYYMGRWILHPSRTVYMIVEKDESSVTPGPSQPGENPGGNPGNNPGGNTGGNNNGGNTGNNGSGNGNNQDVDAIDHNSPLWWYALALASATAAIAGMTHKKKNSTEE